MKVFCIPSWSLYLAIILKLLDKNQVVGFAYAPNFITKIIAEQTGLDPVGLLEVDGDGKSGKSEESSSLVLPAPVVTQKVTTRFPPEPNGYLHLGHAKAVSFNFEVARMFRGECHMRLDDTNPTKEDREYVDSILEDVCWIRSGLVQPNHVPWTGCVRKTSDYFDLIYDCAMALVKQGDAYVDSLSAEEMKEYRGTLVEPGKDSPYRTRSIEENLELFQGMKDGKYKEGEYILRAKIDMASPNLNMRDPALYRIRYETHQETGDKWCIYPLYDFSHPISDAVEGITHSLCTLEFEDHRPFYDWTIEKLQGNGLLEKKPQQIEFSRLNIQSTVLSKRKLIQLVEDNHVNGWDDPRMPTLSGLRRRGVTPSALRLFCERMGISKSDSNIDYGILEDCVREDMDKVCPRAFAVLNPLKVTITNWGGSALEAFEVDRHPKVGELGNRTIPFGKHLYIERSDFYDTEGPEGLKNEKKPPRGWKRLLLNDKVRLRFAYVIHCDEVVRDEATQEPVELKCTLLPETRAGVTPEGMKRVKGIIHWVEASTSIKCKVNQYDRLFRTEEPGKESGDYLKDLNPDSLKTLDGVVVEPSIGIDALAILAEVRTQENNNSKKYVSSLAYQFERSGYYALDPSSTQGELVFNRVVTLRDTWGPKGEPEKAEKQRSRGGNKQIQQKKGGGGAGVVEDLRRVALRVVTILEAGPHPEADALLLLKVDCGDEGAEPRTVVAGLAGKIPVEELVGKKVVAVTNLKAAKMRGIESHAMLLAASDEGDNKVELLEVPSSVANGELISFEGKEVSDPDGMLKSKGALKVWERVKAGFRSDENGEAIYSGEDKTHRMMTSAGPVKTASLTNAVIQ
eukprot:CAMPEP_0178900926 /NCGR_PEP_ID=MMETSP0786-20121207/3736_1 /TAXON_ID=186022 /ORGANISM="Thalassionema frauenfeldii, Strain CCMP 1798" /LENGTH=852 /DNA_ID=CAMNT_0020571967 /DNA_START=140 /DNA_END=2701 /DNA_ORIENTATION=+